MSTFFQKKTFFSSRAGLTSEISLTMRKKIQSHGYSPVNRLLTSERLKVNDKPTQERLSSITSVGKESVRAGCRPKAMRKKSF